MLEVEQVLDREDQVEAASERLTLELADKEEPMPEDEGCAFAMMTQGMAYVTRPCNKEERSSSASMDSRRAEVMKYVKYHAFGHDPIEYDDMQRRFPNATWTRIHISSVSNK